VVGSTLARRVAAALAVAVSAVAPASAGANRGFTVPSKNTTCAILSRRDQGRRPGLYCASKYIKRYTYDGQGVAYLGRSRKARLVGSGNDILLYIGGYNPDGKTYKRPTLRYGKTFRHAGYRCTSRSTGLTCRRGRHGFFLSRERRRYF
jgi:hypothetical protein